nr:DNA polymerase III subunit delta [Cellulomonas xiejunii]
MRRGRLVHVAARTPARPSRSASGSARGRAGGASAGVPWTQAAPAPVVLVSGPEHVLAERACDRIVELARANDPDVEVTRVDAATYAAGELAVLTSPSLFAEAKVVVVEGVERAGDALLVDAEAYLAAPVPDVVVVLRHGGGQRGKRLLDAAKREQIPTIGCESVRTDADKAAFVAEELKRAGRRADPRGVRALVDAVGSDLRELAAACAQLVADTTGLIGEEAVQRYHGGRVEATGFQVADAAVAGDAGRAVALLRHALATGLDPVPVVAAVAARLRTLAKVGAVRGRGAAAARELGMAPWQVDRATQDLRRWTPEGLAVAIAAVAQADAEVKGEGRDPRFAVERAVLRVAGAADR